MQHEVFGSCLGAGLGNRQVVFCGECKLLIPQAVPGRCAAVP